MDESPGRGHGRSKESHPDRPLHGLANDESKHLNVPASLLRGVDLGFVQVPRLIKSGTATDYLLAVPAGS